MNFRLSWLIGHTCCLSIVVHQLRIFLILWAECNYPDTEVMDALKYSDRLLSNYLMSHFISTSTVFIKIIPVSAKINAMVEGVCLSADSLVLPLFFDVQPRPSLFVYPNALLHHSFGVSRWYVELLSSIQTEALSCLPWAINPLSTFSHGCCSFQYGLI